MLLGLHDYSEIANPSIKFTVTDIYPILPNWDDIENYYDFDIYGSEDEIPSAYAGPNRQRSDYAVVVFSFHHDLNEQVKAATILVKEKLANVKSKIDVLPKSQTPSTQDISAKDYLKRLLRVLDAKQSGLLDKEIAAVIFPDMSTYDMGYPEGEKQVNKDYQNALEYIQRKYRSIPLYKSFPLD